MSNLKVPVGVVVPNGAGPGNDDFARVTFGDWPPSPAAAPPPFSDAVFLWVAPDTIITAPLAAGVQVERWADKGGGAQDFVQATPARQPLYVAPASSPLPNVAGIQTGVKGAGRWLVADPVTLQDGTGASPATNATALFFLMQPLEDVLGTTTAVGLSAGAELDRFEFPAASGNLTCVLNYGFPPATTALFNSWKDQPVLYCVIGDAAHQSLYADGVLVAQAATSAPVQTWAKMVLGSTSAPGDAFSSPNKFYEVLGYQLNAAGAPGPVPALVMSTPQRKLVEAWFTNRYGVQVVFDGNSQFKGDHSSGLGTSLPGYTPHLLSSFWTSYVNNGTNGITTPNLTARIAGTTAPLFNPLCSRRCVVMLEIENDLVANGASIDPLNTAYAATAWANLQAYSRACRANGIPRVVVCSGLPIGPLIPPPANYEKLRQATNALLRNNWSRVDATTGKPFFDGFADIGGPDSSVGTVRSTQDPALYDPADETHLNDGGVKAAAPLIAAAVEQAFVNVA
jgi:hypothetical protein